MPNVGFTPVAPALYTSRLQGGGPLGGLRKRRARIDWPAMSVRYTLTASRRVGCPVGVFQLLLFALLAFGIAGAPSNAVAAGGVWKGTAEGIRVDDGELSSGEITSSSTSNYQVELSFSFSVSPGGNIIGGGSGYYTDAHWHLDGVNGKEGAFGCEPPVSAEPFKVIVSGSAGNRRALLRLAIPDAIETNQAYSCGANYTGFATTSHLMTESLHVVGGDLLHLSATQPTSLTLKKTVESGTPENSETDQLIWSFSVSPPGSSPGGGSGGGSGSGGGGGSCSLSLTHVAAKPSPGHAGKPIVASFHVSAQARATLLVSPVGGTPTTVVTRNVPKGLNQLVWGGWLGKLPAVAGHYALTVEASACGKTRSQVVTVTTT